MTDLCNGGDLYDYILNFGHYQEKHCCSIMEKLLSAVNHLHATNIVHRDLKPENVLFVNRDPNSELKLIDFGLAKSLQSRKMTTVAGTPYYVAPEVLKGNYGKS